MTNKELFIKRLDETFIMNEEEEREIKEFMESMEMANRIGEKELATEFSNQIKIILKNLKRI